MKLVSWNLEGRLSSLSRDGRGTPEKIVTAIRELDADILVHPEAFGTEPSVAPEIEKALAATGYESVSVAYDDATSRGEKAVVPDPHLRIMSRLLIVHQEVIRPGGIRNMLSITVRSPEGRELRVIGIHLEDRSEALRLEQIGPLIEYINGSTVPTVMMGDFNAMPPGTVQSRLIHSRAFKAAVGLVTDGHMRYVLQRLSDMATGSTIATIVRQTPLRNTDPRFRPTTTPKMRRMEWMPSIRFAKIDWIFVSPDIEYRDFGISHDLGSDHRALGLTISLKKR